MSVLYTSVILYFSGILHSSDAVTPRIVGGLDANIGDFPFQAQVLLQRTRGSTGLCSGTIFKDNVVITTATCVINVCADQVMVYAGSALRNDPKSEQRGVNSLIVHEHFDDWPSYDIALLILQEPFKFSPCIQPVALSSLTESELVGKCATISGWGVTQIDGDATTVLQYANVTVVSKAECRKTYPHVPDNVLCAGSSEDRQDPCYGDAGAPLMYNNELIGIVSSGMGCGEPRVASLYVKISTVNEWINENSYPDKTAAEPEYDLHKNVSPVNFESNFQLNHQLNDVSR